MIPTPMVCFISLMANLPRGGYWVKASTTIALVGVISTIAQSPDLRAVGFSSITLPVLLSILETNLLNLQAIWAVWQSNTGVYPGTIYPGCFMMIT